MKKPDQKYQNQIIDGYLRGETREFITVTSWIEDVVRNYRWGLQKFHEDIIQDIRLKVYVCLKNNNFRRASNLKTYIYRIAKYTCIDFIRKTYKRESDTVDLNDTADSDNALDHMISREKQELFQEIMQKIEEMCRQMLNLVFIEKLPYREISVLLNIAEGTVKSRVSRCMEKVIRLKEKYWNDFSVKTTVHIKSE